MGIVKWVMGSKPQSTLSFAKGKLEVNRLMAPSDD